MTLAKRGRPPKPSDSAEIRECRTHGSTVFHRYGDGGFRCKRCVGEAVTRRHRRLKQQLVDDFGGACFVCGYARCTWNLHFHHVDPATKSFGIQMGMGKSLAAYRREAEKCACWCARTAMGRSKRD